MKKIYLLMVLVFSSQVLFAEELVCSITANGDLLAETQFSLEAKAETQYATGGSYSFYLHNLGSSKFEMEIYNNDGPSRSYSTGFLRNSADTLTWTLWTRDILLETSCKLAEEI